MVFLKYRIIHLFYVGCVCVCIRYEMLQDNVEGYRKEIASLNEKTQKQAAAIQQSEQTIHTLTQDLRAAAEKLSSAEVSCWFIHSSTGVSDHC